MVQPEGEYGDLIPQKARAIAAGMGKRSLRIAVLGPGLSDPADPGLGKRQQIRDALKDDGHSAFFLENVVSAEPPSESLLERERSFLNGSDVDLIIILHTSTSFGTIAEIAYFSGEPDIKAKTAILFPIQYYTPDSSVIANTVREYHGRLPYTHEHFEACQLVSECRKWAHDRMTGAWQAINPHGF